MYINLSSIFICLSGELQGVSVPAPLPAGLQVLLDAVRRHLPAHANRGGGVRRETVPHVVLPAGMG